MTNLKFLNCSIGWANIRAECKAVFLSIVSHSRQALLILISFLSLSVLAIVATAEEKSVSSPNPIVFVPPKIGLPSDRVGAGSRGLPSKAQWVTLLIPDGGGLTTTPKPLLIWKLEQPFTGVMQAEIFPTRDSGGATKNFQGRFREGYYALDLNRSEYSIMPGRIYLWSVRLIDESTNQIVAEVSGLVERVDAPTEGFSPAQNGLWFDAVALVFEVDLSGRARIIDKAIYLSLAASAGVE